MGLHESTIEEIRERLGFSERRMNLIGGLEQYLGQWTQYGLLESVVIDGSFVTPKPEPGDIDILLVPSPSTLDAPSSRVAFEILAGNRQLTKDTFGCDVIPTGGRDSANFGIMLRFFGHDRGGNERGLLTVRMAP